MIYISTRKDKRSSFFEIIKNNISFGGLYVPYKIHKINKDINIIKKYTFSNIVDYIFKIFLTKKEYNFYGIKKICNDVFVKKNFPLNKNIVSLKKIKKKLFLLKISNGKSYSFKDVAMCFISEIYKKNINRNVICATSGDTGSSCSTFFSNIFNIKTFILSPYNKISNFQFSQISNILKKNVFSISIKGNFDNCQDIVKTVIEKRNFGTVNSINLVRIIVQISYYLYAFLKIRKKVDFFIPTGNFGNAYSCFLLKKMGLPIDINVVTNENDMLYNLFSKGIFENCRYTIKTDSPSMDISKSSNIERLLFVLFKYKTKEIVRFFKNLKKSNKLKIPNFKNKIRCKKVTKNERKRVIKYFFKKKNYVFDTHTSNALAACVNISKKKNVCVLETAKCLKFLDEINFFLKKNINSFCEKKYNVNSKKICNKRKKFFFFNHKDKVKILNFLDIYSNK